MVFTILAPESAIFFCKNVPKRVIFKFLLPDRTTMLVILLPGRAM